jgi:glutamine amidotransferase
LNATPVVSDSPEILSECDWLVFPGVGAFSYGIEALRSKGLDKTIKTAAEQKKPVLGICLGMQLLLDTSCEFGEHAGLGIMQGTVEPFDAASGSHQSIRLPNVGWLPVMSTEANDGEYNWLFEGISRDAAFYFIHSFHANAGTPGSICKCDLWSNSLCRCYRVRKRNRDPVPS